MVELKITLKDNYSHEELGKIQEIILALIACGGLTGMKSGKTIINFDENGEFRAIDMNYTPWRKRKI